MTYELSTQPVSCFVKESATSHFLMIDRSDLIYNPKTDTGDFALHFKSSYGAKSHKPNSEWEEERSKNQEYWEAVKYARSQLYDYYGSACRFFPGAHVELIRIKGMSSDEVLYEASKNGLI